jgi:hypothetical protein
LQNKKKAHEEKLNIPSHKGNANQNHIKILPHSLLLELLSSRKQTTNVGEDMRKKEPSYSVGGNVN